MSSNFVNWLSFNKFDEGVYGLWNYKVPEDKKEQMYDFYMLEYLLEPGVRMYLRPVDFGVDDPEAEKQANAPDDPRHAGDSARSVEDKFYYSLYEVANKLLPTLKHELLKSVGFSIAAELRHMYDDNDTGYGKNNPPAELVEKVRKELGEEYAQMLRDYTFETIKKKDPVASTLLPKQKLRAMFSGSDSRYIDSYQAMKRSSGTMAQWAKLATWLFRHAKWNTKFGGESWAQIAEGWTSLNEASNASQLIYYIDHIYDLEHNTGSVFTKIEKFSKSGYGWIKTALDHKRDLVSPYEMLEHLSTPMAELAKIGIKLKTGKSFGDFENEWPQIIEKKAAVFNKNNELDYEKKKAKFEKEHPGHKYPEYKKPNAISVKDYASTHIPRDPFSKSYAKSVYEINKDYLNDKNKSTPQGLPDWMKQATAPPKPLEPVKTAPELISMAYKSVIEDAWKNMSHLPRDLKIARLLMAVKKESVTFLNKTDVLEAIKKLKGVNVSPEDQEKIFKYYDAEKATESYYGSLNVSFPTAAGGATILPPDEAFKEMSAKFAAAPHPFFDTDSNEKIEQALLKHRDLDAIKLIKDVTAYGEKAARALAVYRKLELMYLGSAFAGKAGAEAIPFIPQKAWHGITPQPHLPAQAVPTPIPKPAIKPKGPIGKYGKGPKYNF